MPATPPHSGEPAQPADAIQGEIAHVHEASRSQRAVGMAVGLLSVRFACSTAHAWQTLHRVSDRARTDVRTVAQVLVAVHDGTATSRDEQVLATLLEHLPPAGWPVGPWPREDQDR